MPTLAEWLHCKTSDGVPLDPVKCAQYQARHQSEPQAPPVVGSSPEVPAFLIRGWNFASAMARWTLAGMPRRTQAEIDERLAICQACPFLQNNHCTKCGCPCVEQNRLITKLALATEKCPEGKWT